MQTKEWFCFYHCSYIILFFFFGEQETKDILETSLEYSKAEYETTVE